MSANPKDAVDCAICPAGRASTKSSDSRLCTKCTPGSYQGTFGMSECTSVERCEFSSSGESESENYYAVEQGTV